jgi:tRNA-specific 2-thiouridylase
MESDTQHTTSSNLRGKKIFVGLSGGVDSAVSAALLQEAGADITGVFIKGWYPPGMPCTWADDRRDAMRVAARLRIPFITLDASVEYKKGVIDYLLSEYAAGRTPNPDVMCNREVKFGAFYEFAKKNNALIATGHYAQNISGTLVRGIDESKDQSYFLWAIPNEALRHTIFPVGAFPKSEVRMLAEKFDVPVAVKKDSQGICFLGSISVDDFLREELSPTEGSAIDTFGIAIGKHDGAVLYTLGERIALHETAKDIPAGPWYVLAKDMSTNTVTVSTAHAHSNATKTISLREVNCFREISTEEKITVQYRYHGPKIEGVYNSKEQTFVPSEPIPESVASGQSLVLYSDDVCVGGGIIV